MNGASDVAIIDDRKLDHYHAIETAHAKLVLLSEAETALKQILAGQRITPEDLNALLAD